MQHDDQPTTADMIAEATTDIAGGDLLDDDESIPFYLAAISKLLLARELRETESHDSDTTT